MREVVSRRESSSGERGWERVKVRVRVVRCVWMSWVKKQREGE